MDKLHYSLFLLIGLSLVLAGLALATVQGAYNQRDVKLEETVNGVLLDVESLKEADKTHQEAIQLQAFDISELRNQTTDKIQLNKNQIVKNKLSIDREHPATGNVPDPDPGDTASTPVPTFTFNIEKTVYTVGENIVFSGVGLPLKPVFIVIIAPDNSMAPQGARTADENGNWIVEFSSEFDWPTGTWNARATQLQERSDPIEFELVE